MSILDDDIPKPPHDPHKPKTPINEIFTHRFRVYEAAKDSFSVGGNRYYVHNHNFSVGDEVIISVRKATNKLDKNPAGD